MYEYLRIRKVGIDVLPQGEPFISANIEKVFWDEETNQEVQVIGDYDRIYRKLSDVGALPVGNIADDGVIDAMEIYMLVAKVIYAWIIEKHGCVMNAEGRLVLP